MRPQRPNKPRLRKRNLLIQCEGQETEPNYIDALCKDCGVRHRSGVSVKRGQSAVVTVNAAITEGSRRRLGESVYDDIWCVLDVEHAGHEASLNEAIALARQHGIRLFLSNPSFETWLIAHFERTKRDFANGDAAGNYLSQTYWRKEFGCDYDKSDPDLYQKLAGRVSSAQDDARWVLEVFNENRACRDSNASTEVYRLVCELLQNCLPVPTAE